MVGYGGCCVKSLVKDFSVGFEDTFMLWRREHVVLRRGKFNTVAGRRHIQTRMKQKKSFQLFDPLCKRHESAAHTPRREEEGKDNCPKPHILSII